MVYNLDKHLNSFLIQILHLIFLMFFSLPLEANMNLEHLLEYKKDTCLEMLQTAELSELWDQFLKIQVALFFDQEAKLIADEQWWKESKNILELGSGNGLYLHKLSSKFGNKKYFGVEKQQPLVEQSIRIFNNPGLEFLEGDAEIEDKKYLGQFDVILFRMTLQHLKAPWLALEHAHKYLKRGGHIIIIDAYDPARSSSHTIPSLEEASLKHNALNQKDANGNRKITIEILNKLNKKEEPLNEQYEIVFTNLDQKGNLLKNVVIFEGEQYRKLYFNHILLFLNILNKSRKIPVDFSRAYDELTIYLGDQKAWVRPGTHYLILKKI